MMIDTTAKQDTSPYYSNFDEYAPDRRRFVRLHEDNFLRLLKSVPANLVAAALVVGSHTNQFSESRITSRQLASEMSVQRQVASAYLRSLRKITFDGMPLVNISFVHKENTPVVSMVNVCWQVPDLFSNGGNYVTDQRWVKLHNGITRFSRELSPESFVTLVGLAVLADESRCVQISFSQLSQMLGVARSKAQERIAKLIDSGLLTSDTSQRVTTYHIDISFPVDFGGEMEIDCEDEDLGSWEILTSEPILNRTRLVHSPKKDRTRLVHSFNEENKRDKETKTTTRKRAGRPAVVGFVKSKTTPPKTTPPKTARVDDSKSLPWSKFVGGALARKWVVDYGMDRCMLVWGAAQSAKKVGGFMRSALEQNWIITEDSPTTSTEVSRMPVFDPVAREMQLARDALLAGEIFISSNESDISGVSNSLAMIRSIQNVVSGRRFQDA